MCYEVDSSGQGGGEPRVHVAQHLVQGWVQLTRDTGYVQTRWEKMPRGRGGGRRRQRAGSGHPGTSLQAADHRWSQRPGQH